jgi:hypothetical protein
VTGIGKSWGKQVDTFSVASLLTAGPTALTNFIICMIHVVLQGSQTLETFYKRLRWSFQALWDGKFPWFDWNGHPIVGDPRCGTDLMGGYSMCLWALICDLDHGHKAYKLPNVNQLTGPCPCCPVNNSGLPWYDFRINATWIPMVYTAAQWIMAGLNKSGIFDIVGVDILTWYPDWMHIKSLGLDKV